MVVLLCVMFATEPSTFQSIVLNFEVVLSLLMYIQGLSVIILVVMIIISIVLVRQALLKMDNYVDNLSGHISAEATEQLNDYLLVWS